MLGARPDSGPRFGKATAQAEAGGWLMVAAEPVLCRPVAETWREQRLRAFADVEPTLTALIADLTAAGFSERDQFAIRLALDEALANGIRHGNREDPAKTV